MVVGEILETVAPDADVMSACKRMKDLGYRLALDDYCDLPETRPLLDFADFVKIDVLLMSMEEQKRVVHQCHRLGIPTIAEKVETDQQFQSCRDYRLRLLSGLFFLPAADCRAPQRAREQDGVLHLLQAANEPTFNLHKISRIFKRDVSLSYRLLRYLNSSAFAFRTEIHSIPHALGLLGEVAMRKWISLVSVAALGDAVADSLLRLPLLRAMFCELIGIKVGMIREANELFLAWIAVCNGCSAERSDGRGPAGHRCGDEIKKALLGRTMPLPPYF